MRGSSQTERLSFPGQKRSVGLLGRRWGRRIVGSSIAAAFAVFSAPAYSWTFVEQDGCNIFGSWDGGLSILFSQREDMSERSEVALLLSNASWKSLRNGEWYEVRIDNGSKELTASFLASVSDKPSLFARVSDDTFQELFSFSATSIVITTGDTLIAKIDPNYDVVASSRFKRCMDGFTQKRARQKYDDFIEQESDRDPFAGPEE
tara:strand:+ start:162 stop:776 length:615 start_codon:yes stop_codon:yes gene_type:complete